MSSIPKATSTALSILSIFLFMGTADSQVSKAPKTLSPEEARSVKKDANALFNLGDFSNALKSYQDLIKIDPGNSEYNFRLGYSYLMTNVDKPAALKYMDAALQSKDAKKEWFFYSGLANMYNNKFDEAIKSFQDYKTATGNKPIKDFLSADRMIEMCNNGKELITHPVAVTFTNLGKSINTPDDEFNPFISADNNTLIFSSRRKNNVGGVSEELGRYGSDVFSAVWKDTAWTKAKSLGGVVNSETDEESVGISLNGDQVILFVDNSEALEDLGTTTLKGKIWQKPMMFPDAILNTAEYEGGATISADGQSIYFSCRRKEGQGGTDLWMMTKDNSGNWSNPKNLGSTINTKFDEDAPSLSPDGKTLYFSSKGHNSMGGFDIFKSAWDANNGDWLAPVNIGYPLNDADDNDFFSMSGDGRFAYIGANRPGGFGDRDIWKIEFNDTTDHPFLTVIKGTVSATAASKIELTKATLENKESKERFEFRPAALNNDFIFTARPGEYTITLEGYSFSKYEEDLTVGTEFPPVLITKTIAVKTSK